MEKDNNLHTIRVTMFDGMVESVEFRCGDKAIITRVGDANIQGNCLNCDRDFTTTGAGSSKRIL